MIHPRRRGNYIRAATSWCRLRVHMHSGGRLIHSWGRTTLHHHAWRWCVHAWRTPVRHHTWRRSHTRRGAHTWRRSHAGWGHSHPWRWLLLLHSWWWTESRRSHHSWWRTTIASSTTAIAVAVVVATIVGPAIRRRTRRHGQLDICVVCLYGLVGYGLHGFMGCVAVRLLMASTNLARSSAFRLMIQYVRCTYAV
jgi:hypothetical protein